MAVLLRPGDSEPLYPHPDNGAILLLLSFLCPKLSRKVCDTMQRSIRMGILPCKCIMQARARRVPEGWQPDSESVGIVQEIKRKVGYQTWRLPMVRFHPSSHAPSQDGMQRFCQKCQAFKPPRSHHCRVCQRCVLRMVSLSTLVTLGTLDTLDSLGRCVLRMDHHCPYTNNCVGHNNYRTFLVFLFCEYQYRRHTWIQVTN